VRVGVGRRHSSGTTLLYRHPAGLCVEGLAADVGRTL